VRALVFSLRPEPLTLADLHGLPGLPPELTDDQTDAGVDLRVLDRLEFELDDGRIVWTRVPSHGLPAQLDALRELMAERPVYEPALPAALARVREAMEFVLETESDVDVDTFEEIILGLVERLEGFSVWSHGVFDGLGRSLIDLYDPPPATGAAPAEIVLPAVPTPPPRFHPARLRPEAAAVVRRARVLAAMARRGVLEAGGPSAVGAAEIERLRGFVEAPEQAGALTVDEAGLMALNPGAWSQRTLVDATWLTESVAVFAWALRMESPPPDDEMVESEPLRALFAVGHPVTPDLRAATLRPAEQIDMERARQLALHQRLLRSLTDPTQSQRHAEAVHTRAGLAAERARALSWLCGA
jgi:hypothetical protein